MALAVENVGLCEFRGLPTFLSTFSAGAWPSFVCWPKAFFHRSLGQRPRNGCLQRFWPKAMFILSVNPRRTVRHTRCCSVRETRGTPPETSSFGDALPDCSPYNDIGRIDASNNRRQIPMDSLSDFVVEKRFSVLRAENQMHVQFRE